MQAIVCVQKQDDKWAIGYNNKLLFHFKDDMKLFKQHTTYKIVVCGRKTLESFPNGMPLKNRIHIVLTRDNNYQPKKNDDDIVIVKNSVDDVLSLIHEICTDKTNSFTLDDVWIIGGEEIYKIFLPYCSSCIVTSVRNQENKESDSFFPNLDMDNTWNCMIIQVSDNEPLTFYEYYNKNTKLINKEGD